jgi:hypothetical protein
MIKCPGCGNDRWSGNYCPYCEQAARRAMNRVRPERCAGPTLAQLEAKGAISNYDIAISAEALEVVKRRMRGTGERYYDALNAIIMQWLELKLR